MRSTTKVCVVMCSMWAVLNLGDVAADDDTPQPGAEQTAQGSEADAGQLPVVRAKIDVVGAFPTTPAVTSLESEQLHTGRARDAGDLLRLVPGVSSGRMGGHGLDPRIRGLGESSIRVLVDGAEIHGGCPNRMDPPSSFAAVESYDEVTVVRGVQTLRYGTAPGTVLFDRDPVRFIDDAWWQASVNAVAGTFHDGPALGFNAAVGTPIFSLEAAADRLVMDSYSDGDGEQVASAFDSRNGLLTLGWTPDNLTSLSLSWEVNRTRDALYAGAGMDSPFSDGDVIRFKFRRAAGSGLLGETGADLYWSAVEHLMDNYSLRPFTAAVAMSAPSTSDSAGGRMWIDLDISPRLELSVGLDVARNDRQALRFAGPNPDNASMLQSVLWPEVDLGQDGLYLEGRTPIGEGGQLRFGLRGDRHTASAAAADLQPAGANSTPRQLWESYYGPVEDSWDDIDVGGFVRWEHRLAGPGVGFFAGLSRTARAADTTQRYIAANSAMPPMRWVGNPTLEVANHFQLDGGVSWSGAGFQLEVTVFADRVANEILRDRAHGQPGILRDDGATVYRNIDARRLGFEIAGRSRIGSTLTVGGDAAYVWAQNTSDDRPIAQTPPLEGMLSLDWAHRRWVASGALRWAAAQTRVDDDPATGSGLDVGETPGWAILSLSVLLDVGAGFGIAAGADNIFDRTYAYHLNRANAFDPLQVQVNEPGRTLWLRLRWSGRG